MRLVVIGQAAFGQRVLDGLIDAGHEAALVLAPATIGSREDPLTKAARTRGLPLLTPSSYRSPEVAEAVRAAGADLGVLAFVTKIVPFSVFDAPRQGSICFHPSLLPRYRGGSALAWQLIRGEDRGGFTIFWVDEGVDTGPILLQREVPIDAGDTAGSLYFEKIFEPGISAMIEAVGLAADGRAARAPQDDAEASHDPLCGDAHVRIVWQRPAVSVYNLVRGADPKPGAYAVWKGSRLRLFGPRREVDANGAGLAGTVVHLRDGRLHVAVGPGAGEGAISFAQARLDEGAKGAAAEVATAAGIQAGSILEDGDA